MRAFDFAASQPWLITEDALRTVMDIAQRTNVEVNDLEALVTRTGRPLVNTRRTRVRDGVAIVPVTGPIMRYANVFSEISGATSTQILATDIRTALDDPLIDAIVLEMHSPGGMAAGINELGDMIFAGRNIKPIIAYGDGEMASAAYWLGSAASEVVIDLTSILGSIGAVMTIVDARTREERAGVRTVQIVSSQSPDKILDPSVDASKAKLQKIVDDLAGVFVSAVARNRDVDEQHVLQNFGGGGLMVGQAAVDAGLADRIGSLESVIAELTARSTQRRSFVMTTRTTAALQPKGPITVTNTTELRAALAAGHSAEEITIQAVDVDKIKIEAVAAAQKEWEAKQATVIDASRKEATEQATKAERDRVSGLNAIAMKGFEKEVQTAIDSGATVADTAVQISKLARERSVTVASLKTGAPAAVNHGGAAPETEASAGKWGAITARFGKKRKTS